MTDDTDYGRVESGRAANENTAPTTNERQVSLDEDTYITAAVLAEQRHISVPQLLRQAVTTQRWFDNVRSAGGRILVEERGKLREILEIREQQTATQAAQSAAQVNEGTPTSRTGEQRAQ